MLTKNDYSNDPNLDTIILMGTIFAGIGYGVVCALYGITVCHDRRNWKMWCMRTWLAILATIAFALQIRWTVVAFVLERNYAGGPHVFVEQNDGDWINVMLNATYVVLSWSADLVMLYRCCIIYSGRLRTYVVFPVIMFIANLVVGSLFLRQLAEPGTHAYAGDRIDYLVAYRTVSLALSAIATGLIVGRILHHRHEMRAFSKSTSDKRFTSVVTMFVESAALETVTALLYIILVGIESPGQSIVLPILGQVQVIAPLVIFYRVSLGQAWSKDTTSLISRPTFGPQRTKFDPSPFSTKINLQLPAVPCSTTSPKPRLSIISMVRTMDHFSPAFSEDFNRSDGESSSFTVQSPWNREKGESWTDSILGP